MEAWELPTEDLSCVSTVLGLQCVEIIHGVPATMAMKEWPVMHLDMLIQVCEIMQ